MAIAPRNESWASKKIVAPPHKVDLSAADIQHSFTVGHVFLDNDYDCIVRAIYFVYTVATDSNAQGEKIQVGTTGTAAIWLDVAPDVSKAVGTVQEKTVASTALLPAGTPLVIQKSAATGTSNTGEVTVIVELERVYAGCKH